MGGNAKYRSHTAVIRNPYNESGFQAMRDDNGNLIRIPESERVVGKDKRTANRANAKERMLNAKSLKQIREMAKDVRVLRRQMSNGTYLGPTWELVGKIDTKVLKLSAMAQQVDSNVKLNAAGFAQFDDIERALGIKLS